MEKQRSNLEEVERRLGHPLTRDDWLQGRVDVDGWTGVDDPAPYAYSVEYYFDADGRYLGPDADGVEPVWRVV